MTKDRLRRMAERTTLRCLGMLERNLTVAAALCQAYEDGYITGNDDCGQGEGYRRLRPDWAPGCGHPVPR